MQAAGAADVAAAANEAVSAQNAAPVAYQKGMAVHYTRQQPWDAERDGAVKSAREGDVESGLATLERLYNAHPDDIGLARDYLVVLGWAGKDKESVKVYRALGAGKQPDYVLESVARSYRNLKNPKEALAIYREALQREPNNLNLIAGEIRSLADAGEPKKAVVRAEEDMKKRGERVETLLAAAYAAKVKKAPVESVRYCERAVHLSPNNKMARHDLILAIADMGSPQVAQAMADAHPGVLSPAEYRRIEGDKAAAAVRWSPHEPASEADRFVATDRTIAKLDKMINNWSGKGKTAQADLNRARFDRMVAYRDRHRMQDVLDEHDRLKTEGVTIPPYAMAAVGDALLSKRQPRQARDVYQQVLAAQPNDFNTRVQLSYAHSELEDFDAAYKQIDGVVADQATWIHLKGMPEPLPNPTRESSELAAGYARIYAGDYVEANKRIGKMADSAPNNPRYRAALGTLYEARGWPRAAQEQFQVGKAVMHGQDRANEAGEARTNFDLYRFRDAETATKDLVARFPENEEVQRLARARKIHNMFELQVNADHAFRSSTAASGGSGTAVEGVLYSPPIYNNWRLFAGQIFAEEEEPNAEGTLDISRTMAGIEFRRNAVRLSVAPTYTRYDDVRTKNVERVGVRGEASWDINDRWNISGHGEMFSRDTPLRAINSGITADGGNINATYRASERRRIRLDIDAMYFHDRNWHTGVAGEYVERLWTRPHFKLDGIVNLAESHNTLDRNRPYFNPKQDILALGGLIANHTIYRRYDFEYSHNLTAKGGAYWQKDFGSDPAVLLRYEHSVQNDILAAKVGATFTRQDYDGKVEDNVSVLLNMLYRF
ncbi:MAG: poly-beta-1,6 N-acetyl-D-glucosamine export porin PgaA [Alphaproteobacteria bacterium]